MTPDLEQWTRPQKSVLYVSGVVKQLENWGLVGGGGKVATPKGVAAFDQLKASGFAPERNEILGALLAIGFPEEIVEKAASLVEMYMDGRLEKIVEKETTP